MVLVVQDRLTIFIFVADDQGDPLKKMNRTFSIQNLILNIFL